MSESDADGSQTLLTAPEVVDLVAFLERVHRTPAGIAAKLPGQRLPAPSGWRFGEAGCVARLVG
jgi:hypothetical protein